MHRQPLLTLLREYRAGDARGEGERRRSERFVLDHPDCFDRALAVGHITGSAWLLDPTAERVLLTHHRKLGKWLQLGGHCDGAPDVLAVAVREAREESGLSDIAALSQNIFDLCVQDIPARPGEPAHLHHDIRFLLQARGGCEFAVSQESHALAWFSADDLAAMELDDAVRQMRCKWLAWRQTRGER